jgi:hypothetical protein
LPEAGAESQSAKAPDAADPRSSPEDFASSGKLL